MICEILEAGEDNLCSLDGNTALQTKDNHTENVRTRMTGRKKRRTENKPIKIDEENVEYIGIENKSVTIEKPIERLIEEPVVPEPPVLPDAPVITEPEKNTPPGKDRPVKPEIISEGFSSEAAVTGNITTYSESRGLIYEIAEELYIKEKTAAELEALAKPPFHKNFDEERKGELNRQVKARTRRLIAAAGESSYTPTFLPEAVYEDCSRPMETKQALLAELLLLIPVDRKSVV